jgi:hypothetical protein
MTIITFVTTAYSDTVVNKKFITSNINEDKCKVMLRSTTNDMSETNKYQPYKSLCKCAKEYTRSFTVYSAYRRREYLCGKNVTFVDSDETDMDGEEYDAEFWRREKQYGEEWKHIQGIKEIYIDVDYTSDSSLDNKNQYNSACNSTF